MDAFFASVEQRDNPALRGKPIAVTGAGERTVITTSSYEARAYGVKTGMTVYEAKRLCPDIILVVGNNQKYAEICARAPGNLSPVHARDRDVLDRRDIPRHHRLPPPFRRSGEPGPGHQDHGKKRAGTHLHGRHRAEYPHRQAGERSRKTRWLPVDRRRMPCHPFSRPFR